MNEFVSNVTLLWDSEKKTDSQQWYMIEQLRKITAAAVSVWIERRQKSTGWQLLYFAAILIRILWHIVNHHMRRVYCGFWPDHSPNVPISRRDILWNRQSRLQFVSNKKKKVYGWGQRKQKQIDYHKSRSGYRWWLFCGKLWPVVAIRRTVHVRSCVED